MALLKVGDRRALPGPQPVSSREFSCWDGVDIEGQVVYIESQPENAWYFLRVERGKNRKKLPLIYIVEVLQVQQDFPDSTMVNYLVRMVTEDE